MVVENKLILSAKCPTFQNPLCLGIQRHLPDSMGFVGKDIENVLFQFHLFPGKCQDFPDPQASIQGKNSDILNVWSCATEPRLTPAILR